MEVVVENASGLTGGADLYKTVQDTVAGRPFTVIRVLVERTGESAALGLEDAAAESDAESLLADPKAVFQRRLESEPAAALSDPERATLATAFDELCSLLEERQTTDGLSPR